MNHIKKQGVLTNQNYYKIILLLSLIKYEIKLPLIVHVLTKILYISST